MCAGRALSRNFIQVTPHNPHSSHYGSPSYQPRTRGRIAKSASWASLNQLCRQPGFAQAIHSFPYNLDGKWVKRKPGCQLVQAVAVQVSGHLPALYVLWHISFFLINWYINYKLMTKLLWYCSVRISPGNINTSSSNSLDVLTTRFQMLILLEFFVAENKHVGAVLLL